MAILKIKNAEGQFIIPEDPTAIKYTRDQSLTDAQKAIARANIGAAAAGESSGTGYGAAPIKRWSFDINQSSTMTITPTQIGENVYQVKYIFIPYSSCQSNWYTYSPFDIIVSLPKAVTYNAYETFYVKTSTIGITKNTQTQNNITFQICPKSTISSWSSLSFAIDLVVDTANQIIYTKLGENGLF